MHAAPEPEVYVTSEIESPQYLVRVYRDSHGITRTVATREHPGATWSPEHLLFAERASEPVGGFDERGAAGVEL